MPEPYLHSIVAADADIDELGHVSNLVYLRWVLETATAHSAARGWTQAEYRALGAIWIVRRHELDYLAQVIAGQQLVAETWVDSWRGASCVRRTTIRRDTTIVARAATTWVFVSLASGKPTRIPAHLRAYFE
ncbi:MAG TPA: thioesterase family protein [Kofleriaceae bacterium]